MRRALSEYRVIGVRTTLPFVRWLMEHPRFIAGDISTDFIAEEWDTRAKGEDSDTSLTATQELSPAAVAALVGAIHIMIVLVTLGITSVTVRDIGLTAATITLAIETLPGWVITKLKSFS